MRTYSKSKAIRKEACPLCVAKGLDNSQDNLIIYDDGHSYCYARHGLVNPGKEEFISNSFSYEYLPLRGISKETFRKYDVKTKVDGTGKPVAIGFSYPNQSTKVRSLLDKSFYWKEKEDGLPHEPGLFGRDRFSSGEHRYVVITEGEFDALTLYQVLRVPVVSVQSSSTGVRDCVSDRAFLNGFERVYLALDNDQPGRECAAGIAKLFDFNKVYQVKFDKYKDANDYLQAGEETELLNLWNNAQRYQPEQIISSFSEFEKILTEPKKPGVPYPFPSFNEKLYGIRTGEMVLITAPEGVGKTELMHAIEFQLLKETSDAIGAIFIEEPKSRHLQAIAGLELGRPVHLPDCDCSSSEVVAALHKAVGSDRRLHIYSHFGSDDAEVLLDTIRFMVSALGCRYVLFDHISMAVSGLAGDDERRALDYLSTRLETMVKELDFALIMVSHVNDEGKTRGSRYISKVADIRIDITRDTVAVDPIVRNTTEVVVSKNRFSGRTGPACKLLFDPATYTYTELESDEWGISKVANTFASNAPANDNHQSGLDQRGVA